tara:strand:+ start:859 stop:1041 length:183 start_codon:yes stop_codon:yes gene_type:complete
MIALNDKMAYGGLVFLVIFLMGLVGSMDMEDEIAEQEFYCEQVLEGHWPDYKQIADEVCS